MERVPARDEHCLSLGEELHRAAEIDRFEALGIDEFGRADDLAFAEHAQFSPGDPA